MDVEVAVHWSDDRTLVVDRQGGRLVVHAHASLSHGLVKAACLALGSEGPEVLAEWERSVGLSTPR